MLPGVTVEARAERPAGAARHDDGRQRRVPGCRRCRRATYTLTFRARWACRTSPARPRSSSRRTRSSTPRSDLQGVTESRRGHRDREPHREGHGDRQERLVEHADHVAAGRPGVSRPPQADSRRPVHAGQRPRPERGRQRPGQRLQLRRCERDAALSSARSRPNPRRTTSRRSRRSGPAPGRVDFDRAGGFSIDTISKSGTNRYAGEVSLPVPDRRHGRRHSTERQRVALRAGSQLARRQRRRPRPAEPALLLRVVLPLPEDTRENRANQLRRAAAVRAGAETRASARSRSRRRARCS